MSLTPTQTPELRFQNSPLDPDVVGLMEDCSPVLEDTPALRRFEHEHGYLLIRGLLNRVDVMAARRLFIGRLADAGVLDETQDPMLGVLKKPYKAPGFAGGRLETLFGNWQVLHNLLYAGPMIDLFERLLGGPILHYDYTWTRQVNPGPSTPVHSDVVYMGRGTHQLYTAWVPIGDTPLELGGLLLLDGSHRNPGLAKAYWQSDVDTFCVNRDDQRDAWTRNQNGSLKGHPHLIRTSLGEPGKWLSADFAAGDVVIFNVYTVHGGTDNHTNRVRLSTDTRYQLAHQAADDRWTGPNPVGHGAGGKRGRVC